jgi:hypothetical protein
LGRCVSVRGHTGTGRSPGNSRHLPGLNSLPRPGTHARPQETQMPRPSFPMILQQHILGLGTFTRRRGMTGMRRGMSGTPLGMLTQPLGMLTGRRGMSPQPQKKHPQPSGMNTGAPFGAGLPGTASRGLGSPTAPFSRAWETFGQWQCAVRDPRTTERDPRTTELIDHARLP